VIARQLVRGVVWLSPAAIAAVVGAPLAVVAILAAVAVLVVVVRGVEQLVETGGRRPSGARRSAFAAAAAPREPEPAKPPADLRRMETLVAARVLTAVGVHNWLRPLMADLAETRVRQHGGERLGPERVPDPLWQLIRPDRPPPRRRDDHGLSMAELAVMVDQLEDL
jgi:hypothetical protein